MKVHIKIAGVGLRWRHWVAWAPRRGRRLLRRLGQFCPYRRVWWAEVLWLLVDLVGVAEWYETVADWLKWGTRPLHDSEQAMLYRIFGDSLAYARIRIDERAWLGPPQLRVCYVSFFTINNWGPMTPDLLVHEAMHVWQYQHWGAVYIPRALAAQRSREGYNYGGAGRVKRYALAGARLTDFNPEQQADLVEDYARLSRGQPLQWGPAGPADLPYYQYFIDQLVEG